MSKELSSIGVIFSIASESVAGTRPTTFTKIPKVFENSELDIDPDTIDVTSYDNLKYKSSISGLIDTTGIQTLTARCTKDEDAETVWDGMVDDYDDGKNVWLCIDIPDVTEAIFVPIAPIRTAVPTIAMNDVLNISLKYTVAGDFVFETKPTYAQ